MAGHVINTSGLAITVVRGGTSNPTTYDSSGSVVNFSSSIDIDIHVQDSDGNDIATALVYIDENDETPFLINTTTDANGDVSTVYSGAVTSGTLRIRKYGYKPLVAPVSLLVDVDRIDTLQSDPSQY